jgi:uncharacterized membrane protein (DUF2068 family)
MAIAHVHRWLAALAGVLGATLVVTALSGLYVATASLQEIETMAQAGAFSVTHWLTHWFAWCAFFGVAGIAAVVSAFGLWHLKRWAFTLWLAVVSFLALETVILFFFPVLPYQFEQSSVFDVAFFGGAACVSWLVLLAELNVPSSPGRDH